MMIRATALLCLAACGAGSADGPINDGPTVEPCTVGISYEVLPPFASSDTIVRASANVTGSPGQLDYVWFLRFNNGPNITPTQALPDNSAVTFPATQDGIYTVRFRVDNDPNCDEAIQDIDINGPGVGNTVFRVHAVAPPELDRPPLDKQVEVQGGAEDLIEEAIQLAAAIDAAGTVTLDGAPVAGYLKFMPAVGSDAVVETFANAAGQFSARVRNETHQVLVIPTTPGVAPQIVTHTPGQTSLQLSAGTFVGGTVRDPADVAIENATVQVSIAGVPSTIGTTDNTGAFTLLAPPNAGLVRFEVTPPPALGLPRLIAESQTFTAGAGVTIRYTAGLTTRSLLNTTIQRGGALAGASVSIVGTVPDAGTITAGGALLVSGEARFSAITNGSGQLPAMRAPAAPLTAVIFPGAAGDHAVTPIDLTNTVPGTINALATVPRSTQLTSSTNAGLAGAVLDAVPTGPLALAGAPTIRRVAGANGALTIDLAPNADYVLRLSDPNGNRAALREVTGATSGNLAASLALLKATRVQGTVTGSGAIPGAIVQFLCVTCTGLERSRPIAEGVTGIDGSFSLAVPDPN